MSLKLSLTFVLAAFICALSQSTVFAQTIYKVEGVVYGPDNNPIPNVLVTLENHARAQIGQELTNRDGRYQFNVIIAGEYYLSVKPNEDQFQPVFQRIELINTSAGGNSISTERVDFTLRPARRKDSSPPGVVFAQTVSPNAEQEYLKGVKSLQKGDRKQAVEQFTKAVELFPQYFQALQQLGLVYIEMARYSDALSPLKKANQIFSKGPEAHLGLGMAYVNLDQLPEGIEELKTALSLNPKLFRAHLYLGMALIGTGDLDAAQTSLKEAYRLGGPKDARAVHLYLASIYDKQKKYKQAIDELEKYLRENPSANNASKIQEAIQKLKEKLR